MPLFLLKDLAFAPFFCFIVFHRFPFCLILLCLFVMAVRIASTKRAQRICSTWPLRTTTAGSFGLPAAQPCEKMSTWPAKLSTEMPIKTTSCQAALTCLLQSPPASRPCNCGLGYWLMQTWQVQNKPKYWLLILHGIHLEDKTAHCTLEMSWKIMRCRSSWQTINRSFLFRHMLCLFLSVQLLR